MSQMCFSECLSDVTDLQCMEAVGDLLQEGIESICNISSALSDAHVDLNTGISIMNQSWKTLKMQKSALKIIKEKLENLDKSMEHLVEEKERIEQENKKKKLAMDKLHKDKSCAEEILYHSESALEQAERNLDTEKEALKKEEERCSTCKILTIVGSVLLAVPSVPTWIAGPILICKGERGRQDATKSIKAAEEEIRNAESQEWKYSCEVSKTQYRIFEVQKEIEKTNKDLKNIQEQIERLKQHLVDIAEIQNTVRRVVHLVSVLSGRVTVLQKQTQRFILWEPVVNVMREVMMAAINIAENQFLYSQGLPGLINTLKENSARLLAITPNMTTGTDKLL